MVFIVWDRKPNFYSKKKRIEIILVCLKSKIILVFLKDIEISF